MNLIKYGMENKYYVPSTEEFHIGFECEEKSESFPEWKKCIVNDIDDLKRIEINCDIRVKYLDKSDIESLGFNADKSNGMRNWYVTDENSKYFGERLPANSSYSFWKIKLIHDPKHNWLKIEAQTSDAEWYTFFEGIIKNISELKRLLIQLGINEQV